MAIFISGGVGGSTSITTTGQNAKEGKETTTNYPSSGSSNQPASSNSSTVAKSSGGSSGSSTPKTVKENTPQNDFEKAGGSAGTGFRTYAEYRNAMNDARNKEYKAEYGYNPRTTQEIREAEKLHEASNPTKTTQKPIPQPPKPPETLPEGATIINQGQAGERILYKGVQYDPRTFYEEQARIGTERMGIYETAKTPYYKTISRVRDFVDRGYGEYVETENGFEVHLTAEGKTAKSTFLNALYMDLPGDWDVRGSTDTLFFSGKGTTTYREAPPLLNKKWEVGNEAVYSSGYQTKLMGISNLFSNAPTETASAYQTPALLNKKWEVGEIATSTSSGKELYIPEGGNVFSSGVLMEEPKDFTEQYREKETQINKDVAKAFSFREGIESGGAKTLDTMLGLRGYSEFYTGANQFQKDFYKGVGDAGASLIKDFGGTAVKTFFDIPQAGTGLVLTKGVLLGEDILSGSVKRSQTAQEIVKEDIGGIANQGGALYTAGLYGASSFLMSFRENPINASFQGTKYVLDTAPGVARYGLTNVVPAVAVGNLYLLSARQLGETIFPAKAPSGFTGTNTPIEQPLTREQLATKLKSKLASEGALRSERMLDVPRLNEKLPSNIMEGEFEAINEPFIPQTTRMKGDWGSLKPQTTIPKTGLPTRSELAEALLKKEAQAGVLDLKGTVPSRVPTGYIGEYGAEYESYSLARNELASIFKNKLAGEGVLDRSGSVYSKVPPSDIFPYGKEGLTIGRQELANTFKNQLAKEGVLDLKGTVPFRSEATAFNVGKNYFNAPSKTIELGKEWGSLKPQTTLNNWVDKSGLPTREELANALEKKLTGSFDTGKQQTLFNVPDEYLPKPNNAPIMGTTPRSVQTKLFGESWGTLQPQTTMADWIGEGGLPTRETLGRLFKNQLASEGVLRSGKMLMVPEKISPAYSFEAGGFVKEWSLAPKYQRKITDFGEVLNKAPKETGTPIQTGKGTFQFTRTITEPLKPQEITTTKELFEPTPGTKGLFPEPGTKAPKFMLPGFKGELKLPGQASDVKLGAEAGGRYIGTTWVPASFLTPGGMKSALTSGMDEVKRQQKTQGFYSGEYVPGLFEGQKDIATGEYIPGMFDKIKKEATRNDFGTKPKPGETSGYPNSMAGLVVKGIPTTEERMKKEAQAENILGGSGYSVGIRGKQIIRTKQNQKLNSVLGGMGQAGKTNERERQTGKIKLNIFSGLRTGQQSRTQVGQKLNVGLGTLVGVQTGQAQAIETAQVQEQIQIQNPLTIQIEPPVEIKPPFTEEPPPGEGGDEPPPPPPPFDFPKGSDILGRKKKKKQQPTFKTPSTMGKRSVYADLFSIHASQVKYGRGTSPSMVKRPETWKYERGGFGRIPTAEQLDKPKPKTNNLNNFIAGFKKRGKKWF